MYDCRCWGSKIERFSSFKKILPPTPSQKEDAVAVSTFCPLALALPTDLMLTWEPVRMIIITIYNDYVDDLEDDDDDDSVSCGSFHRLGASWSNVDVGAGSCSSSSESVGPACLPTQSAVPLLRSVQRETDPLTAAFEAGRHRAV